ncbi:pilus assembly protein CpaD [Limimonas halophila]|uniref:Pilus assembly protein CpaD n=1 Tax=Limimonas halophila TaxID=1082479 RepID=A0A1G7PAL7_9PROT|nr:CpaD family pilus assembly lipoprotein [Limimonas halophila]SDF83318.1 pilus assembly protein CpaD [Limimonas halophila]
MTGLRRAAIRLTMLALAGVMGACEVPTPAPKTSAPGHHEIQVERTRYSHAVSFPSGASELPGEARTALRAFLDRTGTRTNDRIVVTAAGRAGADLAPARRNAVLRYLRRLGYRPADPPAAGHGHPMPDADALVRVTRYHARLPQCPDRSRTSMSDFHNLPTSNFGCSDTHNLGRMVANPRDLLRGRTLGPADATRQSKAIADYRTGELPKLEDGNGGGEQQQEGFSFSGNPLSGQSRGGSGQ